MRIPILVSVLLCVPLAGSSAPPNSVTSPDGRYAAFIREFNLWVRDLTRGQDRQLTTGGIKDFGYATNNAGWIRSDSLVLLWSPDSKKIATFQHDSRGVGEMYLVSTNVGAPRLEAWKYPLPQDPEIFRIHRVIIEVETAKVVRLLMPADRHRLHLSGTVGQQRRQSQLPAGAQRPSGARRARLHRRGDRRDGDGVAVEVVCRRLLRQHG